MVEDNTAPNIPTFDEFLAHVGPLNPHATNAQFVDEYQQIFGVAPQIDTRSTLPSFEEFKKNTAPLNPTATDADIHKAWHEQFGVLGAREKTPTFGESLSSGFQRGLDSLKEQAAGVQQRRFPVGSDEQTLVKQAGDQIAALAKSNDIPADLEEQSVWKKFTNPEYVSHFIGQQLSGNIPYIGGMVAGGVLGGAIGGLPGATAGAMAGGGTAAGLQRMGESYREAYQKNLDNGEPPQDAHDHAYSQSGLAGAVSGLINALPIPLARVKPFEGVLKNLVLQLTGNVAIDTADQATGNVIMGHPVGEGVPEAAAGSLLFSGPETMAGVKAAMSTVKPKELPPSQTPPSQTIQPTPPPTSTPPSPGALRNDPLTVATPITDPKVTNIDQIIDRAKKVTDEVPIDLDELDKAVGKTVSTDVTTAKDTAEKIANDAAITQSTEQKRVSLQQDQIALDTIVKNSKSIEGERVTVVDPDTLPETAPASNPAALTKSNYLALSDLVGLDGSRLAVYQGTTRSNGFISYDVDQKTAWMNANTTVDPAFIAFHEVQHLMQKSEIFNSFRDVVLQELKPTAYQSAQLRHGTLTQDRLFDEMLSDIHGDAMTQERFHQKLIQRLEAQDGVGKAQTKLTQFLDSLKEMIARVKDQLTSKLYVNSDGQRVVDNYVKNLEKVHDALAGAMAEHYRLSGVSAELPVPTAENQTYARAGQERIVVHPDAVKAFKQTAAQRHGAARASALTLVQPKTLQKTAVGVIVSNLLHHLTASAHEGHANAGAVRDTASRILSSLSPNNYNQVNHADLTRFRDEHAKIPVYNQAQWLAREAAIAYGEKRATDARRLVQEIKKLAQQKDFNHLALSFKRDGAGKLAPHFNEVDGEMIIEKGAKEPKFRLPDGREVTQAEMEKTRQRVKPTKVTAREKKDIAKSTEVGYNKSGTSLTEQPPKEVRTREEGTSQGQGRQEGLLSDKTEPTEKPAPSTPLNPDDLQSLLSDRSEPIEVSIRALRESTGDMVMTKEDATVALKDIDESLAKYQQLLKCVQS